MKIIVLIFFFSLVSCTKERCFVCTVYTSKMDIVSSFDVCGEELHQYNGKTGRVVINGFWYDTKTVCE